MVEDQQKHPFSLSKRCCEVLSIHGTPAITPCEPSDTNRLFKQAVELWGCWLQRSDDSEQYMCPPVITWKESLHRTIELLVFSSSCNSIVWQAMNIEAQRI